MQRLTLDTCFQAVMGYLCRMKHICTMGAQHRWMTSVRIAAVRPNGWASGLGLYRYHATCHWHVFGCFQLLDYFRSVRLS